MEVALEEHLLETYLEAVQLEVYLEALEYQMHPESSRVSDASGYSASYLD